MTKKNIILWIICLVIVDQGTKLIIANYFIDTKFDFIDSVFGFHPVFNDKYTYFNTLLGLNLGLFPRTIVFIIVQFVVVFCYGYFKAIQRRSTKLLDIMFVFSESAVICVFCGFYLWKNGVLDFIYLHFWIFDLKDVYINCFVIILLINALIINKKSTNANIKASDYLLKCWRSIKQYLQRNN